MWEETLVFQNLVHRLAAGYEPLGAVTDIRELGGCRMLGGVRLCSRLEHNKTWGFN